MWRADPRLGSLPEQRALGQDDGDPAGLGAGGGEHVLHPRPVGVTLGRHAAEAVAAPLVGCPLCLAPVLQRERRIGDHAVELSQVVAGVERWVAQRVLADDLEVLDPVQQQVHPGDGRGGEHLLLAVELAPQGLGASAGGLNVLDDLDQHAAGAAGRVVDALALDAGRGC